jgi:hypothetical protein
MVLRKALAHFVLLSGSRDNYKSWASCLSPMSFAHDKRLDGGINDFSFQNPLSNRLPKASDI